MKKTSAHTQNEIIIKIKVEPRSSKSGIAGTCGDTLKVKLTAPPVEGKANKELTEVLAKEFGIAKRNVQILSGKRSKNKVIKLIGINSINPLNPKNTDIAQSNN